MQKIIDNQGAEHFYDISSIIGFSQTKNRGPKEEVELLNEYAVAFESQMQPYVIVNKAEMERIIALIGNSKTELEIVREDLESIKSIDDLLKSIRGS